MPTSKRKNRRGQRKRLRRVLNRALDAVKTVRRGIMKHRWGDGPGDQSFGKGGGE